MKKISIMMLAAAGIGLSAAGLPDGWTPYLTGPKEEQAKCTVSAVDKNIKIEDRSKLAEAGIRRNFPVKSGKYYRFTLEYDYPANQTGMEITAYFNVKGPRAGQTPVSSKGISVLKTIQVPEKATVVTVFFYSMQAAVSTATFKSIKIEEADQPFK